MFSFRNNKYRFKMKLGEQYPLTDRIHAKKTREKILLESTMLFAKKGFAAVSMREIAKGSGVKASSLYNHYSSKEALWNAVLDHLSDLYIMYFVRLNKSIEQAESFESLLECMFVELKQVVTLFTHYGFSMIVTEQFRNEKAARILNDMFLKKSIQYIDDTFSDCIKKGWVPEFDTQTVATFFMHSVLISMMMRAQYDMGRKIPYDVTKMFESLQNYIYTSATGTKNCC